MRAPDLGVLARRWRVPTDALVVLLDAATAHGALVIEDGIWSIPKWDEYQKPDRTAAERMRKHRTRVTPVTPGYGVTGRNPSRDRDVDVDVDKKKKKTPSARGTAFPNDWTPNDTHRAIAVERNVDLDAELVKMRDWALAKGEVKKDWDAAFRNWLRRATPTAKPKPIVKQAPWKPDDSLPIATPQEAREGLRMVREAIRGGDPESIGSLLSKVMPKGGAAA